MKTIWTRDEALKILLNNDGCLKAGTCHDDGRWFTKKGLGSLMDFIFSSTNFLDQYSPTFKLRIFVFKLNLKQAPVCVFCDNLSFPIYGESRFRDVCSSESCKSIKKSITTKLAYQSFSDEKKELRAKKIGESNSVSLIERHGLEKAEILKKNIGIRNSLRVQSLDEKKKRIETRKLNNQMRAKDWHSEDTKKKISVSNSITHSSQEYKVLNEKSRKIASEKQSITMKRKIESGEFTPNSNNWKKSLTIKLNFLNQEFRFRSRWEIAYYFVNSLLYNRQLEYEKIRIPYEFDGKDKIYIVDFYSKELSELIEIKPKSRLSILLEQQKIIAAKNWAIKNNVNFKLITEDWFKENKSDIVKLVSLYPELKEFLNCLT
jgi:hypothetical protein